MMSAKIKTCLMPGLVSRSRWKKPMRKIAMYDLLTMILALAVVLASSQVLLADGPVASTEVIQSLMQSPKLKGPDRILQDFVDEESTTRVIVNLHRPAIADGLLNLKDMNIRQQLEKTVYRTQENVLNRLDMDNIHITNKYIYIFAFSAEVSLEGMQSLVDDPDIESIEKDEILKAHTAQGIPLINATDVRNVYDGSGISIAICDTGIDYTHPRLGNGGFPNAKVIGGRDCGDDDNDPIDGHGHGTCCAGIAAGDLGTVGDYIGGVAPEARLYAVKITSTGTGDGANTSDMIEGWEWCITHQNDDPGNPILIISTSFGGDMYTASCDGTVAAMTTAAANAKAAGITLFVSSGNDGYCDSMSWPACISHVVSVGAVYDAGIGTFRSCVAAESCATKNTPSTCDSDYHAIDNTVADMVTSYSNTADFLDILAPSNAAYTTDIVGFGGFDFGDYHTVGFGGTSAACPYAAGAAACLQEAAEDIAGSYLTPTEVEYILIAAGDPITDGKVNITKPRVNLDKAVFCAGCNLWVDFIPVGPENGSFYLPYNTLAKAVTAASSGETICIKTGSSDETITITKAVTLRTYEGTVTIGQ